MINILSNYRTPIYLGRQGENKVREIVFNLAPLRNTFGDGSLSLLFQRTKTDDPYPISIETVGDEGIWAVSSIDTYFSGIGKVQVIYTVNDQIKKSVVYSTKVNPSIMPASDTPPDAFGNWLDELASIGGQIISSKNVAIEEINTSKNSVLEEIIASKNDAIEDIQSEIQKAEVAANLAQDFAKNAEQYAEESKRYAENLHFLDDGSGNVSIVIGG